MSAKEVEWYKGSIVLHSREVVTGEISVALYYNLVLYRNGDDQVSVLPAHKILSVHYYDPGVNINRRLIALQSEGPSHGQYLLFEIVLKGDVSVLRRPKFYPNDASNDAHDFIYFINQKGSVVHLHEFKSKILPALMTDHNDLLTSFMKKESLSPYKSHEIIRIIEYYNEVVRS